MSNNINEILKQRGARYGEFADHASISQALKLAMRRRSGWDGLEPHHQEALEMIQHKIARILNGDPDYVDSWVDIAGYAQLVVGIINGDSA